jgi:hypothetical protein
MTTSTKKKKDAVEISLGQPLCLTVKALKAVCGHYSVPIVIEVISLLYCWFSPSLSKMIFLAQFLFIIFFLVSDLLLSPPFLLFFFGPSPC